MRKLLWPCLTFALLLAALILAPLSGATKNGQSSRALQAGKMAPQKKSSGPRSFKAVNFGVSPTVRELAQAQTTVEDPSQVTIRNPEELLERKREQNGLLSDAQKGGRTVEVAEDELFEKNDMNREIIRKVDPNAKTAPDAALTRVPAGTLPLQVMAPPSVNFEAISLSDTLALPGQGFIPPYTVGEIGPNHFVQMVNSAFRIYNRTGTPLIPLTSIGTLFGTIPGPCAGSQAGQPIVLYDQFADRWLLSETCSVANPNNHQLIAISQTGDPTGAYYLYDFVMPNNKFNDYPKFGVWSDGYYMTDNQFNQAGTQILGAGVFAFDRTRMIAGDPTASYIYFDKAEGCPAACQFGGMLPADIDGFVTPPAGAPAPIIKFDADEIPPGATDSLRIFDFHADFAVPANSTLTERAGSPLAVAAFDPREVPSGSRNVIPQPPPGIAVDPVSDRLMFRLAYRNFGTHESLVMNHTVNAAVNPAFRAGVRYYEIRKTTFAGAWTVQEQATMAGGVGDTEHRWMGSTALNGSGSQAVGYSVSSATVFPSIRYAGRLVSDPPGSLAQGEALLVAGDSSQTHSSGRWGSYSDLTVDPVDDCTFWYTQEYVHGTSAPDNTRWHTRVGAFQFGPCATVQKGILNGTITSTNGGAPIANATVTAGPFIRNSNGSGVYNIDPMGTGTYTVTVSAPGFVTATVPGVTITQGNTTTQNVALTPQNTLAPGTAAITAESCTPTNNALDPGETVTVNLPIVNNGGSGATTTNLVATLQAVSGVSSPSGPQNYGAVAQGSPAVVRPFTFTVSATCGNFVDITLQLQDGATNYGTIVYSLRTGTLGAPSTANYSTGNIATPIPDVNTVDIPINVAATGAVADVNVRVRLNHTFDGDLTISLVAPDNTVVILAANRDTAVGGGDNYGTAANDCSGTPTIFDDAAGTPISGGLPPFAGTFQPETPLSAMNGKSIAGTWKLRVNDNAALDTGTVGCVTLEITRQPFICCGVVGTPVIGSGGAATITAESIAPANNAPDPGETVTATFPLINTGDGNTTNLVATLQNSGGVTPVTTSANYGVVVAAGPAVSRPFTFVASGTCGNNITATLQLQDGAINLGTVTYTFLLGTTSISSTTFSNATAIVIPATGTGATSGAPATPYPSNITVAGVTNPVTKVAVTLKQITHSFPADVDVLLVGPTGVKFVVMSDVIGGTNFTGPTYTFEDTAASVLPSSGAPPASGSFKPTNYGTGDLFPAPAPASPYLNPATAGTDTLAAFNGLSPNGTWNLYVTDDGGTDIGTFAGGWDLTITTTQNICNSQTCALVCPANITVPADGGGVSAVVNYPAASPTGACGVLGYSVPSGSTFPVGTTTVNVTGANSATCSFTVTVSSPASPANVSGTKTKAGGTTSGSTVTYTVVLSNSSSSAQLNNPGNEFTDVLPSSLTLVSASATSGTATANIGTNTVSWNGSIGGSGSVTITITATINSGTALQTITNQGTINYDADDNGTNEASRLTDDPSVGGASDPTSFTVISPANVSGTKTKAGGSAPGSTVTYTVVLSNGSSFAQLDNPGNEFTDVLPSGLTLVSASATSGAATTGANTVNWNGSIAANGSVTITITATINNVPHGTLVSNQGTISYDADGNGTNEASRVTDDPAVGGASDPTSFAVVSRPDLTITKSHAGNFLQGQTGASYTITVTNSGTGPTGNPVTVTDVVPLGLTPTGPNGVVNGWSCAINGQTLTCSRSDVLAGGASYPDIILTVNVANPAPLNVTNTAAVAGGDEDNASNNTASNPTTITCNQDFSLNNGSPLMISRLRMNGPGGATDEFVEIFNPGTAAHTVASGNCAGGGYGVYASAGNGTTSNDATLVCFIPNSTVIPAGGYYLCTGRGYTLGNLGRNGGVPGATALGDAPIGCGGQCTADIPNDAGLALMNVAQGITAFPGGFNGGIPDAGLIVYDKVGFGPYGPGAPAPVYPTLAGNFCEGGACLQPVGDASMSGVCTNPSGLFPVVAIAPACYGQSGQYELLRRQTAFDPNLGTLHQDTNNNAADFIFVSPNPGTNLGQTLTGVSGVTAVLGAAGPYDSTAPPDASANKLKREPFDGVDQFGPRNAERFYVQDPTVAAPANNPFGTLVLRFRYTNNSGVAINGLRFEVNDLSTLCGAQTATPTLGTGKARNVSATPDCGGSGFTAILKVLNSATELIVDSGGTAQTVNGTVMEDLSGAVAGPGPLSPLGGGVDNTLIVNPSSGGSSVGNGVNRGIGNFSTTMGTSGPTNVLRVQVKFGVVRSGRLILFIMPMAKTSPTP